MVGDCETSSRCRPWSGPPGRRWSTRPSTPAPTRSTCTPRSTGAGRGLRPRPRPGFDARRGRRRPDGRQGQHHQPDGPPRRHRHRSFPTGRGHRSTTGDQEMTPTRAAPDRPFTTPGPRPSRVGPYRVVVVDDHAMFRTGVKAEIGAAVAVVGEAADAGSGDRGRAADRIRTWCCWTCTCRAAAASRCCARCTRRTPTRSSWPCRSPTRPRT